MTSARAIRPQKIFDIHVHLLGDPKLDSEYLEFAREWNMPFATSCLGPDGAMLPDPSFDEIRRSNDLVLEMIRSETDLTYGFCYVNPLHGQQALDEIRRCVEQGMAGIKLWIACRCSDERVFPIFEESIWLGVPVLQHAWARIGEKRPGESTPKDVAEVAKRYPDARILMAHMASNWRVGISAVQDCLNVLVDTSGVDPEMGSIEYAVEMLGTDRVLFGSDAPGRDVLCQIGKIPAANVANEDKEKILHQNAERLLGIGANREGVA